jgi:hypothetical protein
MIDFSDTERRALRDYFSALGPSEDGTVSLDDIEEAFISLALCDHREQVVKMFGGKDRVSFEEFLHWLKESNDVVLQVFQALLKGDLLGDAGQFLSAPLINSTCRRKFLLDGLMGTGLRRQRGQRILHAYEEKTKRQALAKSASAPAV